MTRIFRNAADDGMPPGGRLDALSINSIAASGSASALGAGSAINLGNAAQSGTLIYTGSGGSTNRAVNLASTAAGGGTITNNGSGALVFTGAFSNAGTNAKTFTLSGSSTDANDFQSALTDSTGGALSVVKTGASAWSLSGTSSFTGMLSVNQGALSIGSIANSGVNSAIGAGSVINLGNSTNVAGTLNYTGSAASTNRAVNLAAITVGGAIVNSIGTGGLTIAGGAIENTSGTPVTLSTNNAVAWNGSFAFGGTNNLSLGTGVVTIGTANRDITLNGGSTLTLGEVQWNSVNASRVLTVNRGTGSGAKLMLGGFQLNINADTVQGAIVNNTGAGTAGTNAVAVTKQDSGKWELAGNSTYTGPTNVNAGTLVVSGSLSGTTAVNVNGGTLLLGAANRINDSADVVLGGGTFSTGGFSEGDAANAGLGALILAANSTIDFGTGTGSLLHFGSVGAHTGGAVFSILNFDDTGDIGDDRLIFSGSASAFTSVYAQSEVLFGGTPGYTTIQFDAGSYEIIPIPEPAGTALIGSVTLCVLIGCRERRSRHAVKRGN